VTQYGFVLIGLPFIADHIGMGTLWNIAIATWQVLTLMAPYLLLGFAVAGVLFALLSTEWITRHMGRPGLWQVAKASLMGVPLPLCSCSVLPVAFSLRRHGATKGATVSFLASTPQTGADNVIATYAVLGPVFAVFSVAAAFLSGLLAGTLVDTFCRRDPPEAVSPAGATCACCGHRPVWQRILRHALIVAPRDIARPLLLGVAVTALITACVPPGYLAQHVAPGWGAYLVVLAVSIPVYVCSISSIPLAAGLIHMGASPGAAIVFLIVGPATNAATITTLWTRIGRPGAILYLLALVATALACGAAIDLFFPGAAARVPELAEACMACLDSWWHVAAAVALLAILAPGLRRKQED
jgi:uncharacterized membrane protein YraQ (UPF0718 family)